MKLKSVTRYDVDFTHEDFDLSLHYSGSWAATVLVRSPENSSIQQLRLDLAQQLEDIAWVLKSQEGAIIKTVVEAL